MLLNLCKTSDYGQRGFHPLPYDPPYAFTHPLRIEITLKVYVHKLHCSLPAHDVQLVRQRGGSSICTHHVRQIPVALAPGVVGAQNVDSHIDNGEDGGYVTGTTSSFLSFRCH